MHQHRARRMPVTEPIQAADEQRQIGPPAVNSGASSPHNASASVLYLLQAVAEIA
ncbi:hypothetical protein KDX27_09365 [Burkholderia cenocepacia]|uniref:hypothetical protein n=1 Tax=Burkholderia cenocepacia TaxID=95486 RepID=UPI001B9B7994|nr:hypothetical protein [Burkholderia cenocepacia]MBR8167918.1 hypothetical protein [Burkholderia cenocepacia]